MFFIEHIDAVYFIYGLAFLYLGFSIISRIWHKSKHAIAEPLKLLGIFGISHGLLELVIFWELLKGENQTFTFSIICLTWVSFMFLFEFGRKIISLSIPPYWHTWWLYIPLTISMILLLSIFSDIRLGVDYSTRYLFALPGGVIGGGGIILYGYRNKSLLKQHRFLFIWSGVGLVAYGLIGGGIASDAAAGYSLFVTQSEFFALVGSPVQLWRAIIAVVLAVLIGKLLVLFQEEIGERQHLSSRVIDCTSEGVMVTDPDGHIIQVNRAFELTTGYNESEVLGKTPKILSSDRQSPKFYAAVWKSIAKDGHWKGEIWNRRKSGEIYPEWLTISPITDNKNTVTHYVGMFSDISHQDHFQKKLHDLAYYDGLTQLPNRTLFRDRLDTAIEIAKRENSTLALMFLDLDNFKTINDTLGHAVGDQLLISVARRLKRTLREEDTISRLGGDEFTVILSNVKDGLSLARLAEKILCILRDPFSLEGRNYFATMSIGICLYPENGRYADELLKHADAAMYQAKEKGKDRFTFYSNEVSEKYYRRLSLEHDLRQAIDYEQLSLVFQPQYQIGSEEIIGAEALLRWKHSTEGWMLPSEFIAVAEESGLIIDVGKWVINEVCTQIKQWGKAALGDIRIAINISAVQFDDKGLVKFIKETVEREGIDARNLAIELTEGSLSKNRSRVSKIMDQLVQSGIEIAIDDFGTGYSSLSYLKQFPINKLKIDKSFVDGLPDDHNDSGIAKAIISMAKALRMSVIAEGVETQAQLAFLTDNDCDEIQGYLFSRPISADEFTKKLTAARATYAEVAG